MKVEGKRRRILGENDDGTGRLRKTVSIDFEKIASCHFKFLFFVVGMDWISEGMHVFIMQKICSSSLFACCSQRCYNFIMFP